MKSAPKRRVRQITETEVDVDDEELEDSKQWDDAPLFSDLDRKRKRIEVVSVRRTDPPSGYLGTMPPDVSEARLAAKWGGGSYILEGKNADTHIVPGARRQLKIAGDPVFSSEVEEAEYRRSNRLPERGGAKPSDALSVKDLLTLIEEKDEKRRSEQLTREERARAELVARDERERKERDERAATLAREDGERRERERKDHEEREERRRREQREDDDRRARMHREDMERMQAQATQQLAQAQQFFQQLATTMKAENAAAAKAPGASGGEMVKALLTGLQIAREMAGGKDAEPGEKPDLLTSMVSRLPEILQEVRETGASVYREIKGGPAAPAAGQRALPPRRKAPADALTITGKTAIKAKRVLLALKAQGKDPEAELDQLLTMVGGSLGVDMQTPEPTPATPATPPASTRARPAARRARAAPAPAKAAARRPPTKPRPAKPARARGRAA